jgi:hypothetical protein
MGRRRRARGADRRGEERARFGGLFINKHIEGLPYLAAVLDLSGGGMMVRKVSEPALGQSFFAVELGIPWTDERFWIWGKTVRDLGDRQAVRFLGMTQEERARLADIVREARQLA